GYFVPEDVSRYSVTEAISRTLAHHPSNQTALEATRVADANIGQAKASLYPQIKAEGIAGWRDDNAINNLERLLSNDGYRGSLVLEQELFSKASSAQRTMARQNRALSVVDEKETRDHLIKSVEVAYLTVLETTEHFVNAQQNRLIIDRLRELSWPRERFESRPERERSRLEIERLSASIATNNAEAARVSATALLNSLFNMPADAPFLLDSGAFSTKSIYIHFSALSQIIATTDGEKKVMAFFQESAQENNISLQLARLQVERAIVQKFAANAGRYPRLSFRGSLDFTDELTETDLLKEKSPSATVAARLELPLFLGGKTGKDRQIRTAEFNQAEFHRDAVSLETMTTVAGLSAEFFATLSSVPIAMQLDQKASQYLVEITKEYEDGNVSLNDFLDASRAAHSARTSLTALQYQYFQIVCELVHVIGWDGSDKTQFDRLFISKIRERFGSTTR
ncbi:MAG: TolC family protein, partial [Candidatus Zixiibacteriota bacterium]